MKGFKQYYHVCLYLLLSIIITSCSKSIQNEVSLVPKDKCYIEDAMKEKLLKLNFKRFDQEQSNGWRLLYSRNCFEEAATLIVKYIQINKDQMKAKHYILPFHAGQMFAMNGDIQKAIYWMKKGYNSNPSKIVNWNAFVDANLAFLSKDLNRLLKQRELIQLQPKIKASPLTPKKLVGKKLNLNVVNGFIRCFNKSYSYAYHNCRY